MLEHERDFHSWLHAQAEQSFQRSVWFDFDNIQVYVRAGMLSSYADGRKLLGVCVANVNVDDSHRRQGLFSKFVNDLLVVARSKGYTEFQIENVISPEMFSYCTKHSLFREQGCSDNFPCFWKPI